jgi:Protein of unknown function (DUF3124)
MTLNPISSKYMRFEEKELDAGSGMAGCFIIDWKSAERVSEPIIEGIIGTSGTGWITTSVFYGRVIEDNTRWFSKLTDTNKVKFVVIYKPNQYINDSHQGGL